MTTSSSDLPIKDWSQQPSRRALPATAVVTRLAQLSGWTLHGDGAGEAIEKTFRFDNYFQTLAFVNALAWIAHQQDHHPALLVEYGRCTVRWNTHDAGGLTDTDFDCAQRTDTLVTLS